MPRRAGQSPIPPPLEMACLGVIWSLGQGTVHDVAAALAPRHKLAYTTVMTLLDRLVRRGHLARRKAGRSFLYTPASNPDDLRQLAIDELVRNCFSGSRESLRIWLDGAPSPAPAPEPPADERIDTALL